MSTSVYSHRARVAGLSRDRNPEDAELVSARRDLKAAKLAAYITRVVAAAPPLRLLFGNDDGAQASALFVQAFERLVGRLNRADAQDGFEDLVLRA